MYEQPIHRLLIGNVIERLDHEQHGTSPVRVDPGLRVRGQKFDGAVLFQLLVQFPQAAVQRHKQNVLCKSLLIVCRDGFQLCSSAYKNLCIAQVLTYLNPYHGEHFIFYARILELAEDVYKRQRFTLITPKWAQEKFFSEESFLLSARTLWLSLLKSISGFSPATR